jgi:ATP-dependent RNA helicase RhlE
MTFSSFALDARILRGVQDLGFTEPTPIQRDAIPPALEGRDVLACAMTGSGKSAAFLLPILERLIAAPKGRTRALIVTPTRELAVQIHEHLGELGRHAGVSSAAVYGGVGMEPQARALRHGTSVIVATPGRLLDHLQHGAGSFSALEILVLDEADRMLDMGFLPDVRRILRHLPPKRQTLFFSATMPPEIAALSRSMMAAPVTINTERKAAPATGVTQSVYAVRGEHKSSLLLELLRSRSDMESVLVFTRTKHRTNRVAAFLSDHRIHAARIHGNRSQAQRTQALEGFKAGRYRVLVATDIAARGIDVTDLTHVVNLDVPNVSEDYIHRVGRTARAGALGEAMTFVSPEEEQDLRSIERAIGKRIPRQTIDDFTLSSQSSRPPRHDGGGRGRSRSRDRGPARSHAASHPASAAAKPRFGRLAANRRPR